MLLNKGELLWKQVEGWGLNLSSRRFISVLISMQGQLLRVSSKWVRYLAALKTSLKWPCSFCIHLKELGTVVFGGCEGWGVLARGKKKKVGSKASVFKWFIFNNFKVTCWHASCKRMEIKHSGKQCEREVSEFKMSLNPRGQRRRREASTAEAVRVCVLPAKPQPRGHPHTHRLSHPLYRAWYSWYKILLQLLAGGLAKAQ